MRLSALTSNGEEMKMGANASTWLGGSNRIRLQDDGGGSWAALEMKGGWAATFGYATGKQQGPTSSGVRRPRAMVVASIVGVWPAESDCGSKQVRLRLRRRGGEKGVVGDRFGERREMAGAAAKKATTLGATAIDKEEGSSGKQGQRLLQRGMAWQVARKRRKRAAAVSGWSSGQVGTTTAGWVRQQQEGIEEIGEEVAGKGRR
ncbi:hypothetical protein BHE74_00040030 [Ensete ventricosum]|nr:hypothetical protein BHE74_00040030 [Ensete ventricosum]